MLLPVIGQTLVKLAIFLRGDFISVAHPQWFGLVQLFHFRVLFLDFLLLFLLFLLLIFFVKVFYLRFVAFFVIFFLLFILLVLLFFIFLILIITDFLFSFFLDLKQLGI